MNQLLATKDRIGEGPQISSKARTNDGIAAERSQQ